MTKKIFFSTLLILVSAFSLSACFPNNQNQNQNQNQNKNVNQEQVGEDNKEGFFSGSLKDLVGFGKAQKCTWEEKEQEMSGVVYTDGIRSYSEINNVPVADYDNPNAQETKGSMYTIFDGEYLYTWSTASNQGMKMKNDDSVMQNEVDKEDYEYDSEDEDTSEYTQVMNTNYNYQCTAWPVDQSMFDFPKNIEFKDLSAMMENFQNNFQNMSDVCSMLEGSDKEECLRDIAKAQGQQ